MEECMATAAYAAFCVIQEVRHALRFLVMSSLTCIALLTSFSLCGLSVCIDFQLGAQVPSKKPVVTHEGFTFGESLRSSKRLKK